MEATLQTMSANRHEDGIAIEERLAVDRKTLIQHLRAKIETQQATVAVIGLGYVGLPVACEFARVGFSVIGLDIKPDRIAKIAAGISPIEGNEPGLAELLANVVATTGATDNTVVQAVAPAGRGKLRPTTDMTALSEADVITINVETPVDDVDHKPRYTALQSACTALGAVLKPGALVIVESTVAPGTANRIVQPILEAASGMRVNEGFFLGVCPERVMPGKLLNNLRTVSRVCGGSTPEVAELMAVLYRQVVDSVDTTDVVTAELVKTTENAYRDVQIAFANEVALICEDIGADVYRVRELVNKVPQRNMHLPGAGVGGHCIPKDPWLLASAVGSHVPIRLIPAARQINEGMPLHVAQLVMQTLYERGVTAELGSNRRTDGQLVKIGVLGYSYLENSDDTRHSPSIALVTLFGQMNFAVAVHDPYIEEYQGDVYRCVERCDVVVLMVAHTAYRNLDLAALQRELREPILIDGRGLFSSQVATQNGLVYRSIGCSAYDVQF